MINVSVIGYGHAGRSFHTYLIPLASGLVLDSVVEPDEGRRRQAELERGVRTFASVEDMLDDGKADLVVIATPHNTHAPLAVQLMNAGKNVVTDKAMCISVAEADAMISASEANGVLLSVFHNRRWDWDFNTVKDVVAQGMLGDLLSVESTITHGRSGGWRANPVASGGLLFDWGSHLVDQAVLMGGTPERVYCVIRKGDGIEEHARLTIHFKSGLLFNIEVGGGPGALISKPRWFVLGTHGTLIKTGIDPQESAMKMGNIDGASESVENQARVVAKFKGLNIDTRVASVRTSWKSYYQNISDVLNGTGAALAVDPRGVRTDIAVLEAAKRSAESGEAVILG